MDGTYCGTTYYRCENCQDWGEKDQFPEITVFHRITASPEVLAEKLVYSFNLYRNTSDGRVKQKHWSSSLTEDYAFKTKAEAIAATVEKLKEVE
jgi:hypothetical protein